MDFLDSCKSDSDNESMVSLKPTRRRSRAKKCSRFQLLTSPASPSRRRSCKSGNHRNPHNESQTSHNSDDTQMSNDRSDSDDSDTVDGNDSLEELPQLILELRKVCEKFTNVCATLEKSLAKRRQQKKIIKKAKLDSVKNEQICPLPSSNSPVLTKPLKGPCRDGGDLPIPDDTSESAEESTSSVDYSGPSCSALDTDDLDSIKDENLNISQVDSAIDDNIREILKDGQLDLDAVPSSASSILKNFTTFDDLELEQFEQQKEEPTDSDDDVIFVSETRSRRRAPNYIVIKSDPDSDDEQHVGNRNSKEPCSTVSLSATDNRPKRANQLQLTDFFEQCAKRSRASEVDTIQQPTISQESRFQVAHTPKLSLQKISRMRSNDKLLMKKDIEERLRENDLSWVTQRAIREENYRVKHVFRNNSQLQRQLASEKTDQFVLDYDHKDKTFICVHPSLVAKMKPHQKEGIKFMYDCCYAGITDAKTSKGSGCILAHYMGLGKTFQVLALVHTAISYPRLKTKRIIVVCPKSTVMNWVQEIKNWLGNIDSEAKLRSFFLPDVSNIYKKLQILQEFYNLTGNDANCLIIGYEAYRGLVFYDAANKHGEEHSNSVRTVVRKYLIDPGADLIVLDEGHIIKNPKSQANLAVSEVATRRRIILTGTPIQNNLNEYFCMVSFVKPAFLGNEKEFNEQFAKPIKDGQHKDSNRGDIQIMKMKSYILHKRLVNFVQRKEFSVLQGSLPQKYEYVLYIPLTLVQETLYEQYLKRNPFRKDVGGVCLLEDYSFLRKIWTHPIALEGALQTAVKKKTASSGKQCTTRGPHECDYSCDDVIGVDNARSITNVWWKQHISPDDLKSLNPSNKMLLLFEILKLCRERGEKCLVFSGFVVVLNMVEHFMKMIHEQSSNPKARSYGFSRFCGPWRAGIDYYRIDGGSSIANRQNMITKFNDPQNHVTRVFLISTKAGGLGINLIGANRVIILDTSWNPTNDQQGIHRVYRLGQEKTCYVYRLLAMHTMEEKVYSRAVTKQAMSYRVADKKQVDRKYNMAELEELYHFERVNRIEPPSVAPAEDDLLSTLLMNHNKLIYKYHTHERMLDNTDELDLTDQEKEVAWVEFKQKGQIIDEADETVPKNVSDLQAVGNDIFETTINTNSSVVGSEQENIADTSNTIARFGITANSDHSVLTTTSDVLDTSSIQAAMVAAAPVLILPAITQPIKHKTFSITQPTVLIKKLDITAVTQPAVIAESSHICKSVLPYDKSIQHAPKDPITTSFPIQAATASTCSAVVPYVQRKSLLDDIIRDNSRVRSDTLPRQNNISMWSPNVTNSTIAGRSMQRYDALSNTAICTNESVMPGSQRAVCSAGGDRAHSVNSNSNEANDSNENLWFAYPNEGFIRFELDNPATDREAESSDLFVNNLHSFEENLFGKESKPKLKSSLLYNLINIPGAVPGEVSLSASHGLKQSLDLDEVYPAGTSSKRLRSATACCSAANAEVSTGVNPDPLLAATVPYVKRVSLLEEIVAEYKEAQLSTRIEKTKNQTMAMEIGIQQDQCSNPAFADYNPINSFSDQPEHGELLIVKLTTQNMKTTNEIDRPARDSIVCNPPTFEKHLLTNDSKLKSTPSPLYSLTNTQSAVLSDESLSASHGLKRSLVLDEVYPIGTIGSKRLRSATACCSATHVEAHMGANQYQLLAAAPAPTKDSECYRTNNCRSLVPYCSRNAGLTLNVHLKQTLERYFASKLRKNKCFALVPYVRRVSLLEEILAKYNEAPTSLQIFKDQMIETLGNHSIPGTEIGNQQDQWKNSAFAVYEPIHSFHDERGHEELLIMKQTTQNMKNSNEIQTLVSDSIVCNLSTCEERLFSNDPKANATPSRLYNLTKIESTINETESSSALRVSKRLLKLDKVHSIAAGKRLKSATLSARFEAADIVVSTATTQASLDVETAPTMYSECYRTNKCRSLVPYFFKSNVGLKLNVHKYQDVTVNSENTAVSSAVYHPIHSFWEQPKYQELIKRRTTQSIRTQRTKRYRFIPYERNQRFRHGIVSSLDESISTWFNAYLVHLMVEQQSSVGQDISMYNDCVSINNTTSNTLCDEVSVKPKPMAGQEIKRKIMMKNISSNSSKKRKTTILDLQPTIDRSNFQLMSTKLTSTTNLKQLTTTDGPHTFASTPINMCRAVVPYCPKFRIRSELVGLMYQTILPAFEHPANTCLALVAYVERVSLLEHILTNFNERRREASSIEHQVHVEDDLNETILYDDDSNLTTTCSLRNASEIFADYCNTEEEEDEPTLVEQENSITTGNAAQRQNVLRVCPSRRATQIIRIQSNKRYRFIPYDTRNRIHRRHFYLSKNYNPRFNEYFKQFIEETKVVSFEVPEDDSSSRFNGKDMSIVPYTGNTILSAIHGKIFAKTRSFEFNPELVDYLTFSRNVRHQSSLLDHGLKRKLSMDGNVSMVTKKVKLSKTADQCESSFYTAQDAIFSQTVEDSILSDRSNIQLLSPERHLSILGSDETNQQTDQ